jgi:hypothetical protein
MLTIAGVASQLRLQDLGMAKLALTDDVEADRAAGCRVGVAVAEYSAVLLVGSCRSREVVAAYGLWQPS